MKKLFKHLAIVLALALVIGLVPARTAEAADYSLKFKNKYLYVGAKGEKAHGVDSVGNLPAKPIKRSLKFGKGVIKGLGDSDVVTFKSADRAVAKGSKEFQRVFAVGVGETDVAVKVNGEEIGSMHFIVKQNAKSLAIDAASEVGIGDIDINVKVEPATATDIISLVIPEEYKDIAVVKAGTTITTKKPGTFKIQAVAQQNDSTLTGYHVKSEEVELQAAVKVISATQKSSDEVTFVFDNDMTGIADAKDFKVYYKPVTGADVTTAVKSVTIASEDGKTVVVKLWNAFLEDTEYFVEYSGQVTKFTTAKLDIAHAAQIRFDETEITKGKVTEYEFTVLDANGVEMSDDMKQYVTFAGTSTDKIQVGDSTILFDEAGLQVSVTGTFDAWYEDSEGNAKENKFQNAALFKSVDETPVTLSKYYWGFNVGRELDADEFEDASKLAAVEDEELGKTAFSVLLVFSDGSKLAGFPVEEAGKMKFRTIADGDPETFALGLAGDDKLSIEIADPGIAESDKGVIKPVKVGTTQILIKVAGQDTPFLVLPLEVKAKAVPTSMTITAKNDKVKLNTSVTGAAFGDKVVFGVKVKDQYDRTYPGATVTVEKASATDDAKLKAAPTIDAEGKFTFVSGTNVEGAGVLVLKFVAKGRGKEITNSTKSITCSDTPGAVSTYKLELGHEELDQILGDARVLYAVEAPYKTTVKYYPIDSKGFCLAAPVNAPLYDEEALLLAASNGTFDYEHDYEIAFTAFANGKSLDDWSGLGTFDAAIKVDTDPTVNPDVDTWAKLPAKSVTIKLYKVAVEKKSNGKFVKKSQNSIDTKMIAIDDSQPGLTIVKNDDHIEHNTDNDVLGAFDVYYISDTKVPVGFLSVDDAKGTKSVYVKSITFTETVDGCALNIDANVGYTLIVDKQ